ncbi:MAG: hypothetical protein EDM72_07380 [Chlorobiota bacterium]|nr:MAG: hypothetical protein EDM72_07380 [Chlorobiota bacterium]
MQNQFPNNPLLVLMDELLSIPRWILKGKEIYPELIVVVRIVLPAGHSPRKQTIVRQAAVRGEN